MAKVAAVAGTRRGSERKPTRKQRRSVPGGGTALVPPPSVPAGLTPAQYGFCLAYLENGFNATAAYRETHPDCSDNTAQVAGHRTLRLSKVQGVLNERLEQAWKPLQMGGEQALARVAMLAEDTFDERVKLAALKVILEQTGKLKASDRGIDYLAEALRADIETHRHISPRSPRDEEDQS